MKRPTDGRTAFTLVEMLAVIAIVTILVALIMPVMGNAREKARSAKCKSNLRNLQVASISFLHDGDHILPYSHSWEAKDPQLAQWYEVRGWVTWLDYPPYPPGKSYHTSPKEGETSKPPWWGERARESVTNGTLWGYAGKSLKVYVCPTFATLCGSTAPDGSSPAEPVRSYAMNSQAHGLALNRMTNASRLLLFADVSHTRDYEGLQICDRAMFDNDEEAWDGELDGRESGRGDPYPVEAIGAHHDGKGNAIFIDGHVETLWWSNTISRCSGSW